MWVVWCLLVFCGWCVDGLVLVSVSVVVCVWFDSAILACCFVGFLIVAYLIVVCLLIVLTYLQHILL